MRADDAIFVDDFLRATFPSNLFQKSVYYFWCLRNEPPSCCIIVTWWDEPGEIESYLDN